MVWNIDEVDDIGRLMKLMAFDSQPERSVQAPLRQETSPRGQAVVLSPNDNVATALADLSAGLEVSVGDASAKIRLLSPVPFGHKFSLSPIPSGADVVKYGEVIGTATSDIPPGEYVHVHNVASTRGRGDLRQVGR